ncbi:hypothetical protein [Desulfotalea psychrophila]|uniref:Uncharacterized protein n=1 Tax=Desulfotalea psychrophila (strain LSv54 / DSM 12343) TaxID=177439 RepID=Q6AQH9_DESPS|nr:hypothetical protein [Desulfotalea psychrophila]CAG35394.1 hypothetical protein DP0665 [Desulfotalea psychrophila LSv54]
MEVLRFDGVSLDGSKVKSNASKDRALSYGRACQLEKQLQTKIEILLNKTEESDNSRLPDARIVLKKSDKLK